MHFIQAILGYVVKVIAGEMDGAFYSHYFMLRIRRGSGIVEANHYSRVNVEEKIDRMQASVKQRWS